MSHEFTFSVAPMMDWTDRHCRMFHRMLHPDTLLYTEMVTTGALIHGDTDRFLRFNNEEHPVALQLGGSDAADLAQCAMMAEKYEYKEVNLNCGCPSPRVQKGAFGACLMSEPVLVAQCIKAMQDSCTIPVTIKCRIGIDDSDDYQFLQDFINETSQAGCTSFSVHARKAWLNGLSPKENREIPPLDYERVIQLKKDFPHLNIHINGGIKTIEEIELLKPHVDGIMIGREAYQNPCFLYEIYRTYGQDTPSLDRAQIVRNMMRYAEYDIKKYETRLHDITRHMHGLFQGLPGAKNWRRLLSRVTQEADNNPEFILKYLDYAKT